MRYTPAEAERSLLAMEDTRRISMLMVKCMLYHLAHLGTRSSAQGNCSAKSLAASVMSSILPVCQFFLVLLVFHQSCCLCVCVCGGGPTSSRGSCRGVWPLGGLGRGRGLGMGEGGKGGGGRGHFISLAIHCTTTGASP